MNIYNYAKILVNEIDRKVQGPQSLAVDVIKYMKLSDDPEEVLAAAVEAMWRRVCNYRGHNYTLYEHILVHLLEDVKPFINYTPLLVDGPIENAIDNVLTTPWLEANIELSKIPLWWVHIKYMHTIQELSLRGIGAYTGLRKTILSEDLRDIDEIFKHKGLL